MLRTLIRYGSGVLLSFAPLLTSDWSLLDWLGYHANAQGFVAVWHWLAPKPQMEMQIRLYATLFGNLLLITAGYFDAYRPSRTLDSFRHAYLSHVCKKEWRKRLHKGIRVNVMFLR